MKTVRYFNLKGQVSSENLEGRLVEGELRKVVNGYVINGDIQSRTGQEALVSSPLSPALSIVGIGQHLHQGTGTILCVIGTMIYRYASGNWEEITGTVSLTSGRDNLQILTTMTATELGGEEEAATHIIGTNGVDALWRWSGQGTTTALNTNTIQSARSLGIYDRRVFLGDLIIGGIRNPSLVSWSLPDDPESFDISSRSKHLPEGGSVVTGITPLGTDANFDAPLIVFKDRGIYAAYPVRQTNWTEYGTEDYRWIFVADGPGSAHQASVVHAGEAGRIYFMNRDGIFSIDRRMTITRESESITDEWENLNLSRIHTFRGVYIPSLGQVRFFVSTRGVTYNNRVLVQDVTSRQWQIFKGGSAVCASCMVVHSDGTSALYTGDYGGMVYRHNTGYTDNGNPIVTEIWTDFLSFGDPVKRKQFLEFFLEVDSTANLTFSVDYLIDESGGASTFGTVGEGRIGLGSFILGTHRLSGTTITYASANLKGTGRRIQFRIKTSTSSKPYRIKGFGVTYQNLGYH